MRKRTPQGWSEYTYAHLLSCIKRLANYLRKTGHLKGCFIGIIGDNSPEWVIAFMAAQWIGGVVVPLDLRAKEMELSHIIEHSGLRTIFASPRLVGLLKGMIQKGDLKKKTLLISLQAIDGCDHLPQVFSAFKDDARREEATLEDLAIVQYTSGTTGNPKGVMLTHKNLSSNINSLYQAEIGDVGSKTTCQVKEQRKNK